MKILQVNASYKPAFIYGGPTMSVSKLSEELSRVGHTVEVFTTTANGSDELPVEPGKTVAVDGVPVTYFKRLTYDHSHFSPALLRRLWLRAGEFDVIHIHAWWNLVSVLACLVAQWRGLPVVVSPRGTLSAYSFGNKNSFAKRLIHALIGRRLLESAWLHVTSPREQDAMTRLLRPQAIFNIPNFVTISPTQQERGHHPGNPLRLLFLSRIEAKKGLEILFHALNRLDFPYRLTIAGDGDSRYVDTLKALADGLHIRAHIDWIGFQQARKFDILRDHDLLVLPSYDENFGNVVIESLSTGTAVLVSRQVGLAGYVRDNQLGWVSEHDAASFADALNRISRDPASLQRIREQAPLRIVRDFSETKLTRDYLTMYHQIIRDA